MINTEDNVKSENPVEYLTEAAYTRWYRQYQININYYIDILHSLRVRVDPLIFDLDIEEIQKLMNEIDEHLELARPRDFNNNGRPLQDIEKFSENTKVLINLFCRLLKKPDKYNGIYQEEKDRITKMHQQYNFKDKLNELREKINIAEEKRKYESLEAHESHESHLEPGQTLAAG